MRKMGLSLWFAALMLVVLQGPKFVRSQVPAMFVFGDSLVDVGNNNFLSSIAKANYIPYGCDFSEGPSGRFTNGKTIVDMLGEKLGVGNNIPAFADPSTIGGRILRGVNYASAAAGILDETGQHYGERFSLRQQVLNFESTLEELRRQVSSGGGGNKEKLSQYLAKSIAVMVFGSNDYINNYLMPSLYSSSYLYSPPDFANLLLDRYAFQILALHSLGFRKFLLSGIGPIGCIPDQIATGQAPPGRCVDHVNQMLGTFNQGLRSLLDHLNANHSGAIFLYGNTYGVFGGILNSPASYGFSVVDRGCCGIGWSRGQQITCLPFSVPCPNRNQYVFWDAFHPTQAANAIVAQRAFSGPPSDCYPINVQQMAFI